MLSSARARLDDDALRLRGILTGPAPDESDIMVDALLYVLEHRGVFDEAKHPRNPKGSPGGGKFKSIAQRVEDALTDHHAGKGDGKPLKEFTRPQLLKVARERGITVPRGLPDPKLHDLIIAHHKGGAPEVKAPAKAAKKAVPKKVASPLRAKGRNLADSLDYTAINVGDHSAPGVDKRLVRIQREQGFDGPAHQVNDAEWQKLVDAGGTPVYRGVRGRKDGPSAQEIAQGYTDGELAPSRGVFGSGTYFVSSRDTADKYANGEAHGGAVFEDPKSFTGGATVEAMLLPDARILDWKQSERLRLEVGGMAPDDTPETAREKVLADEGRMAAALGYDAIRVKLGGSYGDEIIILNRTATAVRAPAPGGKSDVAAKKAS